MNRGFPRDSERSKYPLLRQKASLGPQAPALLDGYEISNLKLSRARTCGGATLYETAALTQPFVG
jgi:hypothetical protein